MDAMNRAPAEDYSWCYQTHLEREARLETRAAACRKDTMNFLVLGQTVKSFPTVVPPPKPAGRPQGTNPLPPGWKPHLSAATAKVSSPTSFLSWRIAGENEGRG